MTPYNAGKEHNRFSPTGCALLARPTRWAVRCSASLGKGGLHPAAVRTTCGAGFSARFARIMLCSFFLHMDDLRAPLNGIVLPFLM